MTNKEEKYKNYLEQHIANVKRAFDFLMVKIGGGILSLSDLDIQALKKQIEMHDASKYNLDEFTAYSNYLYGNKSDEVVKAFRQAVKLHKSRNPHHPEYWENEMGRVEKMPDKYILEMICDWWAFSLAKKQPLEILEWYDKNKDDIKFSDDIQCKIDAILQIIRESGFEIEN